MQSTYGTPVAFVDFQVPFPVRSGKTVDYCLARDCHKICVDK